MCGIAGYIGKRRGVELRTLLLGQFLGQVEYRGYDSAGVAFIDDGRITVIKTAGKISDLSTKIGNQEIGVPLIAHTRWATHGKPSDVNAHPHTSCRGHVAIVHNGIIENAQALRAAMEKRGHRFSSETDSEILAHLIGEFLNGNPVEAVRSTLSVVEGAIGLAVIFRDHPGLIVVARRGSPICIGVGEGEYFVASDARSFRKLTDQQIVLDDDHIGVVTRDQPPRIIQLDSIPVSLKIETIDWDLEEIEPGDYSTHMSREICLQPVSLRDTLRGRVTSTGQIKLGGLVDHTSLLENVRTVVFTAAGTSLYAGMVGEVLFEEIAGLPAVARNASELANREHPVFPEGTLVWAISQSGQTADVLSAIELVRRLDLPVFGICNAAGSQIARETQAGVYCHAGQEIGVASTKAFTSQVAVLMLISLYLRQLRQLPWTDKQSQLVQQLQSVPDLIQRIVDQRKAIRAIAEPYRFASNCLFLGRGILYPVAMEGALKLKEISYIHAEGYPMAEMKHGPIALIDESFPTVVLVPRDDKHYGKIVGNIQELRARGGPVVALATEGDEEIAGQVDDVIYVPTVSYYLTPLIYVVVLQLFAYYIARKLGRDVDQPRNLAKSVTVH